MTATNGFSAENSPNPGLTKRLQSNKKRLLQDETWRLFDWGTLEVLGDYALDKEFLRTEVTYLKNLKDAEGRPFCRSMGKGEDILDQLDHFVQPEKASFLWNEHCINGVRKVQTRYERAQLSMVRYESSQDIVHYVGNWNTSAGWTGYVTGKTKKRDFITDNLYPQLLEHEAKAKDDGSFNLPIILGFRTQGSGAYDRDGKHTNTCKMKKRFINVLDIWFILSESRWGYPATQWLRGYSYSALGKTDEEIAQWVAYQRSQGRHFISLDYSKYDSTIPSWLIRAAFKILRSAFKDPGDLDLLSVLEEDFINKDLALGEQFVHVSHGNPSGSRFTAIINGICNEVITETWLDAFGLKAEYIIMGDDNLIYIIGERVDAKLVNDVSTYIYHNFGVKVNADKSNFGSPQEDPEFMSRYWTPFGAWRPLGEIIALALYPEKPRKIKGYSKREVALVVIHSYILSYPLAMRRLIDVPRFYAENSELLSDTKKMSEVRDVLPYNLRTYMEAQGLLESSPSLLDQVGGGLGAAA